jgi:hypothetical protein
MGIRDRVKNAAAARNNNYVKVGTYECAVKAMKVAAKFGQEGSEYTVVTCEIVREITDTGNHLPGELVSVYFERSKTSLGHKFYYAEQTAVIAALCGMSFEEYQGAIEPLAEGEPPLSPEESAEIEALVNAGDALIGPDAQSWLEKNDNHILVIGQEESYQTKAGVTQSKVKVRIEPIEA